MTATASAQRSAAPGPFCRILLLLLFATANSYAQQTTVGESETTPDALIPADEFDRGTPRRSIAGFVAAIDDSDYATAAEFLDLRYLLGETASMSGVELARQLSVITRRGQWIGIEEFVDLPLGRLDDGLPDYRDLIGVVQNGQREEQIYIQRVPRDDGVYIWKISNATVALIPELYAAYGYGPVVEWLRNHVPETSFLGYELFKWVLVIIVAAVVYLAARLLASIVRRMLTTRNPASADRVARFMSLPVALWFVILAVNATANFLGRGATVEALRQWSPIPVLITLWVIFAALNLFRDVQSERLKLRERPGAALVLRPATNALKLLTFIGAILFYLDQVGINITTVLAGLGVGGIAVALALQKPLEDVFGAITLYTQQPVRVGDFCRIGRRTGTIEEIGLRTTRLRTLDDTVIAIPNARLASEAIDNISARQKVLFRPTLRLSYDTSREQIERIQQGIVDLFSADERILQGDHRVRFKEIANDGLLIECYAYIDTAVWAEYLAVAEDLNKRILEIVAASGSRLSPPVHSLQVDSTVLSPQAS